MSGKHYDETLVDRLPANNFGNDLVLNSTFAAWEDHVATHLQTRNKTIHAKKVLNDDAAWFRFIVGLTGRTGRKVEQIEDDIENYRIEPYSSLLERCLDHEKEHGTIITSDSVVVLVHPLYAALSHQNRLTHPSEGQEYLNRVFSLLEAIKKSQDVGVMLLETLHHYAAATSLMVEEGLVDSVVFTQFDNGVPLGGEHSSQRLESLRGKQLYLGGGYVGVSQYRRCLDLAVNVLAPFSFEDGGLWLIDDISLRSPQDSPHILSPLRKEVVYVTDKARRRRPVTPDQILSLEQATQRLEIEMVPYAA